MALAPLPTQPIAHWLRNITNRLLGSKTGHNTVLINVVGGIVQSIVADKPVLVVILDDYKEGDVPKPKDIFECGIGEVETDSATRCIVGLAAAMKGDWASRSQRAKNIAEKLYHSHQTQNLD